MLKRALLLSVLLLTLFSLFLLPAEAASSGSCGDNVTWSLSDDGVLTISGTGPMADYKFSSAPWYSLRTQITALVVEEGVTHLGNCTFAACTELVSAQLPQSLLTIGHYAFDGAVKLSQINLPPRLTDFGLSAFYGCAALEAVHIPSGVTALSDSLFKGCTSLAEVILPDQLTRIGDHAFHACSALTKITLPATATDWGTGAFAGSGLTSITFPENLTVIPDHTFSGCAELSSVRFHEGITTIGECAFQECYKLTNVTLPQSLKTIKGFAFTYTGLVTVTVPDGVTSVGENAFASCQDLLSVTLGRGVTTVSKNLFSSCYRLVGVNFQGPVTSIGYGAFSKCRDLQGLRLPEGIQSIGDFAFSRCDSLAEISLPASLTQVGKYIFNNSPVLDTIYYPGTQDQWVKIRDDSNSVFDIYLQFEASEHHVHNRVAIPEKKATCAEAGFTTQISCVDCGEILVPSETVLASHSYVSHTVAPTPDQGGYCEHLCLVCGHHYRDSETTWEQNAPVPIVSGNQGAQDYYATSSPIHSYLTALEDGTLLRVEYTGNQIVAEAYDDSGKLVSQHTLTQELPIFGGFHASGEHYYLIFGQSNPYERETTEVIRIVQYDLQWNRLDSVSIYGANTSLPFYASAVRTAQSGDMLYIRTAHRMYRSSDGLNHQANMTILLRMSTMEVTEKHCWFINTGGSYVSHSFDQYILVDDGNLVAADHGDAYPARAALLFRWRGYAGSSFLQVSDSIPVLAYQGKKGDNLTGASLGGFEASSTHYLLAGNSIDQYNSTNLYGQRNIFLISTPKDNFTTKASTIHWLTKYTDEDSVEISVPHLVKIDGTRLMVLWTEGNTLKYTLVKNESGFLSEIYSAEAALSDCKPILTDGKVVWYVTNGDAPVFYWIDPDAPETVEHIDTAVTMDPCASGHQYSMFTNQIVRAPSLRSSGLMYGVCRRCEHREAIEFPVLSDADYTIEEKAPTCIEKGSRNYLWKVTDYGNYMFTLPTDFGDHTWDTGAITSEPTPEAEGVKTYTCTVCGETKTERIPKLEPEKPANPFVDVPEGKYFTAPVLWAVGKGITSGTGNGTTFEPGKTCNRQQIVMFLWRAAGKPEPESMNNPFTDVTLGSSFIKPILWAVEQGITQGTGDGKTFSPLAECTRQQIVMFLWRSYGKPEPQATESPFTDVTSGSSFFKAIMWAVEKGVTKGTGDGSTFSPKDPCTRGQIVTFLHRAMAEE